MILEERHDSRPATIAERGNNFELRFFLLGTADDKTAAEFLVAQLPESHLGQPRISFSYQYEGEQKWNVVARYASDPVSVMTSFSTGGGTETITQAKKLRQVVPATGAPDHELAINFDGKKVNGVSLPTRQFKFQELHRKSNAEVDTYYVNVLKEATTKINSKRFRNHEVNEVLLENVNGKRISGDRWELTFEFAVQETMNVPLPPELGAGVTISRQGWDYIQYVYKTSTDGKNKLPRVRAAYSLVVFDEYDFDKLNIPIVSPPVPTQVSDICVTE